MKGVFFGIKKKNTQEVVSQYNCENKGIYFGHMFEYIRNMK